VQQATELQLQPHLEKITDPLRTNSHIAQSAAIKLRASDLCLPTNGRILSPRPHNGPQSPLLVGLRFVHYPLSTRSTCTSTFLELTAMLFDRPCSPRLATRPRNATVLQQGISMGISGLRGSRSKFRVLVAGCGG
jgi:hypothetical protein